MMVMSKFVSELLSAATSGNLQAVQCLVENQDANAATEDSSGALIVAAFDGHLAVVAYLAGERDAAIDAKTTDGSSALILAAQQGHLDVVKYLADERGAAIDAKAHNGSTALIQAAQQGHLDVVKYLADERGAAIDAKAHDGTTALIEAAYQGHLDVVKYCAGELGAAIDAKAHDGTTALIEAAYQGHLDVVKYCAGELGAAIDAKADDGSTALMAAAKGGHRVIQRYLAGLAAAQSQQKADARVRELAEAEERARVVTAELLEESETAGKKGKAKNSRKRGKPKQTKEQPDPTLESLRQSMEASAMTKCKLDAGEPSMDSCRLTSEPPLQNPDVEALHRRMEEQVAEIARLNEMLASKDDECAQLARRNQDLFEELTEMQRNYKLVSTMHDDVVKQNGAAQLKIERKKTTAQQKRPTCTTYPALAEAEEWLRRHQEPIPIFQRLEIPVLCLRWTQASINRKMMFGDGESIFKLVDQLERGAKNPCDINKHLDVVQYEGDFISLSNRRLAALMMYQSLHRDRLVKASCRVCSNDTEEFESKNTTTSQSLGIDVCNGDPQHFGATIFQRGEYVIHELEQLRQRHPENDFSEAIAKIRTRCSAREPDGCSLTLTQASQPLLSCRAARCRSMPPKRDHRRY
jgi:ankyrin repeat protein